jgi:hypothetical protein
MGFLGFREEWGRGKGKGERGNLGLVCGMHLGLRTGKNSWVLILWLCCGFI